jgi:hypothetical protein
VTGVQTCALPISEWGDTDALQGDLANLKRNGDSMDVFKQKCADNCTGIGSCKGFILDYNSDIPPDGGTTQCWIKKCDNCDANLMRFPTKFRRSFIKK